MANHLKMDPINIKLGQRGQKGSTVPPLEKVIDIGKKAWSHRDHNHEELEEKFDTRRENLESSLVLDPAGQ